MEAQGVAVAAHVGVVGAKQAEAALVRLRHVGERGGHVHAAAAAVRYQLFVEQRPLAEVEYPQPLLGGGAGVVDHRQRLKVLDVARAHRALRGAERHLEDVAPDVADAVPGPGLRGQRERRRARRQAHLRQRGKEEEGQASEEESLPGEQNPVSLRIQPPSCQPPKRAIDFRTASGLSARA